MLSRSSTPQRAETSAPLPSGSTPKRNYGWVDLPCGKRCWFAQVPRRDEDFRNYIEIMDAFGRDTPETVRRLLFWCAYRIPHFLFKLLWSAVCRGVDFTAQELSTSSGPADPKNRITAAFSKYPNREGPWFDTHFVHIYYNGDIPEAKYDSHSDPSICYHMAERMRDMVEKSGDEPLTVLPQASSRGLPPAQNPLTQTTSTTGDVAPTRIVTTTHTDSASQTAFKPQINSAAQPHPMIQPSS